MWRAYLEGTVQVSQSRLNVCDNYKSQVSDPAKTVRFYKEQQLKKVSGFVDRVKVTHSFLNLCSSSPSTAVPFHVLALELT